MVQRAAGEDEVGSAGGVDALEQRGVVVAARVEADVMKAAGGDALGDPGQLRAAAIDGDHPLVQRSEHVEQQPIAGADIDGERVTGQQRTQRGQVGQVFRGRRDRGAFRLNLEDGAAVLLARGDQAGKPREAAVLEAQPAAFGDRVGDQRVGMSAGRKRS